MRLSEQAHARGCRMPNPQAASHVACPFREDSPARGAGLSTRTLSAASPWHHVGAVSTSRGPHQSEAGKRDAVSTCVWSGLDWAGPPRWLEKNEGRPSAQGLAPPYRGHPPLCRPNPRPLHTLQNEDRGPASGILLVRPRVRSSSPEEDRPQALKLTNVILSLNCHCKCIALELLVKWGP